MPISRDHARYRAFLEAGMHGQMAWLAEHETVRERLDGPGILAGARSVVCVARRYPRGPAPASSPPRPSRPAAPGGSVSTGIGSDGGAPADGEGVTGAIARYARGRDYHGFLRHRLRRLASFLRKLGTDESPVQARPLCDKEPILERAWAVQAGLGFIGKNGMLIVPGLGSMVLLGEVVTTLDLVVDDVPAPAPRFLVQGAGPPTERCGACTRCLDACPTGAFVSPFVLDARRCVSYLTIERHGPIPEDLRAGMGKHLFGCDECQSVCPFNGASGAAAPVWAEDGDPFAPLERWKALRLASFLGVDEVAWRAISEGTPLRRAGRVGIARNAAIALANQGDASVLPALRAAASDHDDPTVRDAAAWAVARIAERTRPPPPPLGSD